MPVSVRCEASVGYEGQCPKDAAGQRHLNGQPYLLCTYHLKMPPTQVHLDTAALYRRIHPRRNGA